MLPLPIVNDMRALPWILFAALALPGAALAQMPDSGTGTGTTQPGGTSDGTTDTTPGGDVVLNPVGPIGEDDPDRADDAARPGVARPPLEGTGVDAVGDLEDDEDDDLGTDVDPIEEVDPLGDVDRIGDDANRIGAVDPIDPGIATPEEERDERDELEPLP